MSKPQIQLRGRIDRVETTRRKPATTDQYGQKKAASGGELKLTILVPRPEVRKRPSWGRWNQPPQAARFDTANEVDQANAAALRDELEAMRALPEPVEPRGNRISKKAMADHKAAVKAHGDVADYIEELVAHADDLEEWERESASFARRSQQFVMIAAVGLTIEGEQVAVTLEPDDQAVQQMMPEFSGFMLAAGDASEAAG